MLKRIFVLVWSVTQFAEAGGLAQTQTTASSQRPISPTVLASSYMRNGELVLLVLWRGDPGWFWRSGGDSARQGSGGSGDRRFQIVSAGGQSFRLEYDFRLGTVNMLGRAINLSEVNLILVDVDSGRGPEVAAMLRTERSLTDALHPETAVIRRHPNIYPFLQCDKPLPASSSPDAPLKQQMISSACQELQP